MYVRMLGRHEEEELTEPSKARSTLPVTGAKPRGRACHECRAIIDTGRAKVIEEVRARCRIEIVKN